MADPSPVVCPTCHADTLRVMTVGGRYFTVDAVPHPDGFLVPEHVNGQRRARVLTGDQLPAQVPAWRPHTCGPSTRRAPRCTVCGTVMPADLARLEGWTTHPSCDPSDAANAARALIRRTRESP